DELKKAIEARRSAMKGGASGEYIDAVRLLPVVASLRKRDFAPDNVPEDSAIRTESLLRLARLARKLRSDFAMLLKEEIRLRRNWRTEIEQEFGVTARKADVLVAAQALANEIGSLVLPGTNELHAAKNIFDLSPFDEAIDAAEKLPEEGHTRPNDVA